MTPVSRLVGRGVSGMRVVFGVDGVPVTASELAADGARLFPEGADAGVAGVMMTNDRPTVEVVLGALVTGTRLVSLPLPGRGADMAAYAAFLSEVCKTYELAEIVAADELATVLEGVGVRARGHSRLWSRPLAGPSVGAFELVQFTSGSTRRPRPVVLSDAQIGANVAAMLSVVAPRPGDALVSWLPLAHDMGLVGMLLTGLAAGDPAWTGGGEVVLLDPKAFLRRPAVWVEALSRWKGTFTAAPDFAYRMVTERPARSGVDLSALRCAIVGGEIVRAGTLTAFASAYGGQGADPRALCPAYGMAELGVAATLTPPEVHWRDLTVETGGLAENRVRRPMRAETATVVVASGPALPGYELAVHTAGAPGAPAATGEVANVAVRGPSLGVDGTTGTPFAEGGGWFRTGDAGFLDRGWLYLCGRVDDWLVTHGRNVYAPAVEAAVGDVSSVRSGRVTAVGLPTGEWVVVAEPASGLPLSEVRVAQLRREIRRAAVDVAASRPDEVVVVAPGRLPLTSSGKLQRHEVRARLLQGGLADMAVTPVMSGAVAHG